MYQHSGIHDKIDKFYMSNKDIPISSYISRLRYDEKNMQASASAERRE